MKMISIGELLMRLTVPDKQRFSQARNFNLDIGGSEANVAIALSQFGWETGIISALPANELGTRVKSELRMKGLDTSSILNKGSRIGLYFLEEGSSLRSSKIIYDRSDSSFNDLTPTDFDWNSVFEDVQHLHWSAITPAISENAAAICRVAVDKAAERGITISCDLHYRKNLWNYGKTPKEVIPGLLEKSTIVVGDPSTINALTGIEMKSMSNNSIESADELAEDYRKLMYHFPSVKYVSMLLRTIINANHHKLKGALVSKDQVIESRPSDIVNIVDRIGGGDAYMAGLLYGLNHFEDKNDSLNFAITTSALKHTIKGDYYCGNYEEVTEVMHAKQLGKIIR
ncbi:sugar kinase [Fulvivirga ulvae]|uniref:sugar kinase n=1 Tax=Fulvivirga ulvae TaxID=2904245 RepID=UPI001F32C0AD|nr:sugar kinase [Fulvivirga ulvae]UII31622.1 sugar kinase [Fulvivirga ulvae]